jgi:hypothetical protein
MILLVLTAVFIPVGADGFEAQRIEISVELLREIPYELREVSLNLYVVPDTSPVTKY